MKILKTILIFVTGIGAWMALFYSPFRPAERVILCDAKIELVGMEVSRVSSSVIHLNCNGKEIIYHGKYVIFYGEKE